MSDKPINLTGGRRLARNVVWNLLGTGAPLLVAIVAVNLVDHIKRVGKVFYEKAN